MKYVIIVAAVLLAIVVLVVLVGFMVPRTHQASVRAQYQASPDAIYRAITDVAHGPEWRSGLKKVDVLSRPGEQVRWRETADWGTITFVREVDEPARRVVGRIADEKQGFGGTWTYDIAAAGTGSVLTITEDGVIDNPLYRFMSRFVLGYYKSLETYARDLGKRLGEPVNPERVPTR